MNDDLLDRVLAAVEDTLRAGNCVPIKVYVVAEIITELGDRVLVGSTSEDMRPWEVLGLLRYAELEVEAQMRENDDHV